MSWRQRFQQYLPEFVYGGMDGSVTTFAVVAGAVGGGLDSGVILILGFANLLADGFSMSVGAYLSAKTQQDRYQKNLQEEIQKINLYPVREREELRRLYREKGFEGPLLDQVVEVLSARPERWAGVQMTEKRGMLPEMRKPVWIGGATFISFLIMGLVPLIVYIWEYANGYGGSSFLPACLLTAAAFALIGYLKSAVNETPSWTSMLETVLLGASAAFLAYFAGALLDQLLT